MLLSEVSKFESSLLVIHVEKPVNGLTAANISVYDLRVEPVILFGQANGVRDLQCFGLRGTRSVFLICLEREARDKHLQRWSKAAKSGKHVCGGCTDITLHHMY